jgi:hypothetical protein
MRMDNTIANDVLERYNENGKVFVPRNFTGASGESYTRYDVDNIDINEEMLSGMGTFHATQFAALRRMEEGEPKMKVQITPRTGKQLNLDVPSELHELKEVEIEISKPETVIQGTVLTEWYSPDQLKMDESLEKDLAWILTRLVQLHPDVQQIDDAPMHLSLSYTNACKCGDFCRNSTNAVTREDE